ncbi:cytochrome c oxidase subunit II [Pseudosulfitobacter pseudonitzschiae]|uniref:cytochrome c oxidase subunit II n=1 Tax=Pseudosulfitobacter pseudonitzschiae TaxID=1402135 RepID=UPI001E3343E9|nr:c-type cytochrome [Pseudosulfitobacter pseudonitzschiae]MCI2217417.1 c-type cytochrome [Pseudosulfitobacter pseudonitzschiae]UFE31374.1 c-type cytochrome [Pseudosulfitobacter pseudonitzschiae]UFE40250.1 c-type cytochrome [Pseudosulfitobacter pseudonitzschiae]UFE45039.1 c-type cytochrome [Pseudosulfitobacter pseudonitzschiae]UFE49917.1 c-type cytochrome [Pseudosulfitobacter pseudonitzschiae]
MTRSRLRTVSRTLVALAGVLLLPACGEGRQSVLNPSGRDALLLYDLALVMFVGALVLWLLVGGLFVYVTRINPREMSRGLAEGLIVGGGVLFPVVLLGGLLVYSLPLMQAPREAGEGMRVHITAEQWWWRVEYELPDGSRVTSANELRLPVGQRTGLVLNAHRVIHAFWVPALGGKADMIPGRETYLSFLPESAGTYRGQCAEFCGASHALMAFETVVMAPEDFEAWLAAESRDATPPQTQEATRGAQVFAREGCGSCHTVRGTQAVGQVGPDLTHMGSRVSLGAGILGVTPPDFANWIAHTETLKPEVAMPSYDHLSPDDLTALAAYLGGLQ